MAKTYPDILTKRGIGLFLSRESLGSLRKFDSRAEYAVPGQTAPVFCSPKQRRIGTGKNPNLIADMCWYGADEARLVRAVRYGMVVPDAGKHHLDRRRSAEEHSLPKLYQKCRRFHRKPGLTERRKLVITACIGYVLEDTIGKVVDFVEEVLGYSIQAPELPEVPVILGVYNALRDEFYEICRKHHFFDSI